LRLKILKKLTASLNSEFTGSYKKKVQSQKSEEHPLVQALRGIFRLCVLHVVFFDIIVENGDIFDFSRCRHFLDHVITPKIGNFPIMLI